MDDTRAMALWSPHPAVGAGVGLGAGRSSRLSIAPCASLQRQRLVCLKSPLDIQRAPSNARTCGSASPKHLSHELEEPAAIVVTTCPERKPGPAVLAGKTGAGPCHDHVGRSRLASCSSDANCKEPLREASSARINAPSPPSHMTTLLVMVDGTSANCQGFKELLAEWGGKIATSVSRSADRPVRTCPDAHIPFPTAPLEHPSTINACCLARASAHSER